MKHISLVVGTRPEVIKMAPVYRALKRVEGISTTLVSTGQHRELLDQAMRAFDLVPDVDLRVMTRNQSLTTLTCRILEGLEDAFRERRPDLVLAHGDTTTCFSTALSCFYHRIPVAHVEAGLRTLNLDSPFPEEFNRQSVAKLAELHFAPTASARENLVAEGVDISRIHVTGTTAVDAVRQIIHDGVGPVPGGAVSTITLHRRENSGEGLRETLLGIADAARLHPEMAFVYPIHPSPSVRGLATEILGAVPNIQLREPMDYRSFIGLLARSQVVLTDSGGIQEEAAFLGRRVLLLRDRTERFDGMNGGLVSLVGTERRAIAPAVTAALRCKQGASAETALPHSPSAAIAEELMRRLA